MMKKSLSKLERVPLREAWKHEANGFTPRLAEDETQWGAYLDWFVQRIVKMIAVFRPVIQGL